MKTYKHSGTLGDLIYSLQLVKKMGGGQFQVALENIERCVAKYGYRPEDVDPQHKGRFTLKDYEMLKPLIQRQPYIDSVGTWTPGTPDPDVDLDHYRSVLYRTFEGNILKAYHLAFDVPFTDADYSDVWLEADPVTIAPIVVTRSARYRPPNGDAGWQSMIDTGMLNEGAVFVGTPSEHKNFTEQFKIEIPYHPVNDFLELAGIVAGSELVVCNQGFTYSLAVGLGKSAVLELNKIVPQAYNECYFPRDNIQYF
jgi:hypothetical protein